MEKRKEMTRYAFMSNMEAYMKQLLANPGTGKVSDFLRDYGIDEPKALEYLLKPTVEGNPDSSIMSRTEKIVTGEDGKDMFRIEYKFNGSNYRNKIRNLYISLFESNIIEGMRLNEEEGMAGGEGTVVNGATNAQSSGPFVTALDTKPNVLKQAGPKEASQKKKKTVFFTESQINEIKKRLEEEVVAGGIFGDIGYDGAPFKRTNDPAYNHKDMIKNSIQK